MWLIGVLMFMLLLGMLSCCLFEVLIWLLLLLRWLLWVEICLSMLVCWLV